MSIASWSKDMKLTIFAATGGIGRQLFEQAVAAGHEVTAVARRPENLPMHPANVSTVTADLSTPDLTVLAAAVQGADAVLSGLAHPDPVVGAGPVLERGLRFGGGLGGDRGGS
jgi:uncharacterized protein YbjT (DUF2867 family)